MPSAQDLPDWALGRIQSAHQAKDIFELLSSWAKARGVTLPAVPLEPLTCCARGCQGCVWIAFFEAADYWRERALLALGIAARHES